MGSINLAANTAPRLLDHRMAPIQLTTRCSTRGWTSLIPFPELRTLAKADALAQSGLLNRRREAKVCASRHRVVVLGGTSSRKVHTAAPARYAAVLNDP